MQSSRLVSITVLQRSRVISTATNRRPAAFAGAAATSNIWWSWWLGPMMTTTTTMTMTTKRCAGGTTTSSDRSDSSRSSSSSSVGPNARRGSGGNNSSGSSKQSSSQQLRRSVPPPQPSPHPPADAAAIAEFSRDLSRLHQQDQFYRTPPSALPALWESQPTPVLPPDRRQQLWDEVARLVDRLHNRLIERPVIRPDRKYRREVSMIEERLLQHLVSCVYDGSTDVYPLVETILSLMSRFQMDPFYSHCEAAVYIAAREGRWTDAAKLYQNLYVDGEATYPLEDPTMGLYCIARHAKQAGALPVESVLDAVAKLSAKGNRQ